MYNKQSRDFKGVFYTYCPYSMYNVVDIRLFIFRMNYVKIRGKCVITHFTAVADLRSPSHQKINDQKLFDEIINCNSENTLLRKSKSRVMANKYFSTAELIRKYARTCRLWNPKYTK